jgi:ElaB/YqjD/DUF883 family membrane-anchored ribosome-binding protein
VDVEDCSHCYGLVMNYMEVEAAAYRRGDGGATFVACAGTGSGRRRFWIANTHLSGDQTMPQPSDELPEGTDHIINGAMETGGGSGAGGAGQTGGGGSSSGFIGASGGDGTGGTATGGGAGMAGNQNQQNEGGSGGGVVEQLRDQATALRDQAGDRVREFAEGGKTRASDALEELSRVVGETAETIDEKLGEEYGDYARKAADAVSGFADTLRRKDVDELYDNVRDAVRKSPGIAIGVAAILGFTLVRLVKSGMPEETEGEARSNRAASGGGANAGA